MFVAFCSSAFGVLFACAFLYVLTKWWDAQDRLKGVESRRAAAQQGENNAWSKIMELRERLRELGETDK